jgi:phosphatidylserine decarboxylase
MKITAYLPFSYISWLLGALARMPLPQPLARWTIQIFASVYQIDHRQATEPLDSYRCIGDFFIRDLKSELRPIGGPIVSPVDARVRNAEPAPSGGVLPQIKDKTYSLQALFGGDAIANQFSEGHFWNFYLSPSDAHHIYAPVAGSIVKTIHIPGRLWPVNDWALNSVDALFAVNERIITIIESEFGTFAVIMVGATNVGRISLSYDSLVTNRYPWSRKSISTRTHSEAHSVACGEKIGTFNMGSSVILLSQRQFENARALGIDERVCFGQSLLT